MRVSGSTPEAEAMGAVAQLMASDDLGVLIVRVDGVIDYANSAACRVLGTEPLAGQRLQALGPLRDAEDRPLALQDFTAQVLDENRPINDLVVGVCVQGDRRWLRVHVLRSGAVGESPPRLLLLLLDITASRQQELSMFGRFSQVLDAAPVGICIIDEEGRFEHVNPAYQQLSGYTAAELVGQLLTLVVPEEARAEIAERHRRFIETGQEPRSEQQLVTRDGKPRVVLSESCRISGPDGRYRRISFVIDITARKLLEQKLEERNRELEEMVSTDSLTGLCNRRRILDIMHERVEVARRYGRPLAVMMIDLDFFKTINDSHGHPVGDEVLVSFARLLKSCARDSDSIGRIGGEEFVLVMPESTAEGACSFLERLRTECARLRFSAKGLRLSFSAGVSIYAEGDNVPSLLRRADKALYAAKGEGRGRYCVSGQSPR